jgi:5-methyltetrahydropteroyltriglutamate--homocysteine methyltransferase
MESAVSSIFWRKEVFVRFKILFIDDLISIWHICYGSVDGQTDIWEDKAAEMMPMFAEVNVSAIHFESTHRDFREMEAYRRFPPDKVLGLGFIDVRNYWS